MATTEAMLATQPVDASSGVAVKTAPGLRENSEPAKLASAMGSEDDDGERGGNTRGLSTKGSLHPPATAGDELTTKTTGVVSTNVAGQSAKITWDIRGTGLWAGAVVVGGAVFFELNWRSPVGNPSQFMAALFLTFVCGILVSAATLRGRLTDALREKQDMRGEMNRMAEEKGALYERVLGERLTSGEPPPKKKKKK